MDKKRYNKNKKRAQRFEGEVVPKVCSCAQGVSLQTRCDKDTL